MLTLTIVTKAILFLVARLQAASDKMARKADRHKVAIDKLIAARVYAMEKAGEANALASNLRKLSK